MWSAIQSVLKQIDDFVWGVPLMVLILSGGLLLTVRLGLLQVRKLGLALKWMVQNEEEGEGEISSFAALCTALSATIGTGNIVGVATAVCAGGPGALFWMIVAAFLGMATKYAEGLLAVKYRVVDESGHSLGGPPDYRPVLGPLPAGHRRERPEIRPLLPRHRPWDTGYAGGR